jgi:GTP-binding protein
MNKKYPQVAIIGRTNSGKSTLFNRLSETRKALISPMANTTRDRNFADIAWQGKLFTLVDTGGLDSAPSDELGREIQKQVMLAAKDADLILFLIDGVSGVLPQDKQLALLVKKMNKPVILGINKIDNQKKERNIDPDYYKLNFQHIAKFSALNGSQTGDLLDLIVKLLPASETSTSRLQNNTLKLAIIGRPNVGKSSLINAILNEERVIVSDIAHTTRDINDVDFVYKNTNFTLIDTAGLRRKNKVGDWKNKLMGKIEKEGVQATLNTMDRADVVALILETQQKITAQDQILVQLVLEHQKNIILVFNKWDLIENKGPQTVEDFINYFNAHLGFAKHVPMIFVSALKKQRVKKILDLALEVDAESKKQISDEELADLLKKVMLKYRPRQKQTVTFGQDKKPLKIHSLKQIKTDPPLFYVQMNKPQNMPAAILKIIEKEIRDRYEFLGVPVKITVGK